ncbi:GntR family transcriptional regulator [Gluconacetobacter liquefaciens]|uniref:GntR family transcriptional regulator n=1 Tax=Gluconacetobacter liquefaciens TaxID=89584 RepID=A0A370FZA5_GLULI|nr:GntR family transcriptional regulator [Gluconacetobacter liquefaciens]MBB2188101.1 GntR family transcriptional regulator [Gluconacetobacter liquefaciens]RDI36116.1 DNA-binding GntR family transcriptional regulator [Gluconacetobacter liquefaciens]GBQ96289.1 GntR family transcriptional regulator [Gluconacetobacter liquefaciens NRIC 0522]GEB38526.1 GntR family transcriptional regulator [Gluconacetobacter liquefaciens]
MHTKSKADQLYTRSISDQLYDLLRERVLSGELPAGKPIRQDVIASSYQVSKIPVREALARLQQDGFVSVHAKRGFFATSLTRAEAEDVFRLRLRIEPEAAALGAQNATPEDALYARETLEALEAAIDRKDAQRGVYNSRFHYALVKPGAGPTTLHVLDLLNVTADRYVRFHLHMQDHDTRANQEHRALLECWLKGNKRQIENLMRDHIQTTLDDLRKAL